MKKSFALLCAVLFLFSGCTKPTPVTSDSTMMMSETPDVQSDSNTISNAAEQNIATEQVTLEIEESTDVQNIPMEQPENDITGDEIETKPVAPEITDQEEIVPKEETTIPTTPVPTQKEEKPSNKPQQNTPVSGRPTSYSTCKDTGSSQVWVDPAGYKPDYYEETDSNRTEHLEYLRTEGNPYFYWIQEDTMRMYLGRTYGVPFYTSYEIAMASKWESSNPAVAIVNDFGFVTPLSPGVTTISVHYEDAETGEKPTRRCRVTVTQEPTNTYAELEQRAKDEAKKLANYIMYETSCTSDLAKIAAAATFINIYIDRGHSAERYQIVDGQLCTGYIPGYDQPFGTLITLYSTCAGNTRALGMILEYMGFEWYHVNEGKNTHQWCVVYDVDGQTAFADGAAYGIAGYGERQEDGSNWQIYQNGGVIPF